ncbi:MAG: type II secretion system F family protein [Nitrospinae bacterium]|nr:type II secretion system F family protein [Nitrospinota bacterium]
MPDFQYRAVDGSGQSVSGVMAAMDETALESKLAEIGYFLLEAGEKGKAAAGGGKKRKKLKRRDVIDFCIQTEALLTAGVSLLETIKTLSKDAPNLYMREILSDVARNIEAGYSFYEAVSNHPAMFSEQMMSMIQAGEQSGSLPETFRELTRYLEWLDKLISDIKQATIYPSAVLIFLVIFITILFTFVVPRFITILVALNLDLPMPTRVVMGVSTFFVNTWWMWLIGAMGTPVAIRYLRRRLPRFALWYDLRKLHLPVFGELNLMFTLTRFSQNFATLFRSGIPIMQNLGLCEGLVGNKVMEKAVQEAKKDVQEGVTLSESFSKANFMPPIVLRMLAVGEATGDLGTALDNVAKYFNEEIPRRIKKIFGIMEPAVMLTLIIVVGFTALAIFMPILSLLGGLKK